MIVLKVRLVPYNPEYLDESIMWTEASDLGNGYRAIRMANNIHLNMDALKGIKELGGVQDGTIVALWKWNDGDNQKWKVVPYGKFPIHNTSIFINKIICWNPELSII